MKGRESFIIVNRAFWFVWISATHCFESLYLINGYYTQYLANMTNWAMFFTWFTFLSGLFSTHPMPLNKAKDDLQYKHKLSQAWKFYCIFYPLSLLFNVICFILYWSNFREIFADSRMYYTNKIFYSVHNTVPLVAILIESALTCQPLIRRHYFIFIAQTLIFLMI